MYCLLFQKTSYFCSVVSLSTIVKAKKVKRRKDKNTLQEFLLGVNAAGSTEQGGNQQDGPEHNIAGVTRLGNIGGSTGFHRRCCNRFCASSFGRSFGGAGLGRFGGFLGSAGLRSGSRLLGGAGLGILRGLFGGGGLLRGGGFLGGRHGGRLERTAEAGIGSFAVFVLLGGQFLAAVTAEEGVGAISVVPDTLGSVVAVHQVTAGIALAVTIGIQALDGHIVAAGAVHIVGAVIVGGDTRIEQAAHLVTAGIAGVVTIVIIAFISDKVTAGAVHIVGTVIVGGDACIIQATHLVTAGIAGVVTIVIIAFISDKVTAGAVHIVGTVIVGGDACIIQATHLVTAGIAGVVTIVIIAFISDRVTAGAVHIVGAVVVGGDACIIQAAHLVTTGIAGMITIIIIAVKSDKLTAGTVSFVCAIVIGDASSGKVTLMVGVFCIIGSKDRQGCHTEDEGKCQQ